MFIWDSKFFRTWCWVLAIVAIIAVFAFAFMGEAWKSLFFLLAAVWWVWLGRYWSNVAARKVRHRDLKAKRLARERNQV